MMRSYGIWRKSFAVLPHRSVSGKWIWLRWAYRRQQWVYTGFVDELEPQWGELFDVLKSQEPQ